MLERQSVHGLLVGDDEGSGGNRQGKDGKDSHGEIALEKTGVCEEKVSQTELFKISKLTDTGKLYDAVYGQSGLLRHQLQKWS